MPTCTVHVADRWDAVTLLRQLWAHGSWLYQQAPRRWLVTAQPVTDAALDEVLDVVTLWARNAGRAALEITVDGEHLVVDPATAAVRPGTGSHRPSGAGARPHAARRSAGSRPAATR